MRRGIWVGAAIVVAIAAAIPLWLVLDDGGVRRLGAIDAASTGQAGQLTLAGVNGGAPIPIDAFAFRLSRPVGSAQPEVDSIGVELRLGTNLTQLVNRAVAGSISATGKVELVRSINGTLTAYLTFNLTNVRVDGFDDGYSTTSGSVEGGAEKITLRYEALTMSCIPSVCAEPTQPPGTVTELAIPDDGANPVKLESGSFSVPKDFKKDVGSIAATVAMPPSYLLPALFVRARDNKRFVKPVEVNLVRPILDNQRKVATYKFGAAALTLLEISYSGESPLVQVELASQNFSVTTYTYTSTGVPDKSATFCHPTCPG